LKIWRFGNGNQFGDLKIWRFGNGNKWKLGLVIDN
jgi:hypothetical protein